MSFFKGIQKLFGGGGMDIAQLADRLGVSVRDIEQIQAEYDRFEIAKRSKRGTRVIHSPSENLRYLQRRILTRLLSRLKAHPCATGYERGHSIVTNARLHVGKAVVVRMDVRDFFTSTRADRVRDYFRAIGWNTAAARELTRLTTHEGGLPQGAITSPRLSNLVNYQLDARMAGMAAAAGATYSRYADDMTFSFDVDDRRKIRYVTHHVGVILEFYEYRVNRRKLRVLRRHQRQRVSGLVVNETVNLPRTKRRQLRAIRHRAKTDKATLTESQLVGWSALESMIQSQRG